MLEKRIFDANLQDLQNYANEPRYEPKKHSKNIYELLKNLKEKKKAEEKEIEILMKNLEDEVNS